jgi:hypothetical protein
MRIQQRGLDAEALHNALASLEIIEAYPDHKYLPSFLLRSETAGAVFHAQIATDVEGDKYPRGDDVHPRCGRVG